MRATGAGEAVADDLVSALSKAVAATGRPAKIATLSMAPVANLMAHVFGPAAVEALILRRSAVPSFSHRDGSPGSPLNLDPAKLAIVPRFVDAETFDHLREAYRSWLLEAAAIVLQFPPSASQIDDLESAGFARTGRFMAAGRRTAIFLREEGVRRSARDPAAIAGRSEPRRLVIVDPCLGRAAGHYEGYARMLTEGARALGLRVVWAGHEHLDPGLAPAGVEVRRSFRRSFFDLGDEEAGAVDLSPELSASWTSLLEAFDDADTHILMHSADAHQLRAAAAVFEERPPSKAVVHINFQTSPRFMPGRLAGGDVHAAVLRLRKAPAWERSLFFWAETRRLAAWLSDWLVEDIPTPPFLGAWAGAPAAERKADAMITLAFLGEARPSKGFLDLPEIADHIAAHHSLAGALRLVIQNWPPFRGDLARHEAAVDRLSRHPFVTLVNGVLAPAAYDALMTQADLLLLAYDTQTYGLQGSGILAEGLARGKIVIARAGTAVADEARQGVGFTFQTADDLASGLVEIIEDFDELAGAAAGRATRFRQENNPRRFVAALGARARGLAWQA